MDFDDLDDLLDDNSYVPSFAKREPPKPSVARPKQTSNVTQRSISNEPVQVNSNPRPSLGGGLMGLHKESAKNQPTTFEDFFKQDKQEKPKALQKNTSMKNLQQKNNKQDDLDSIFSNSRTGMRRPMSRGGPQISPEKEESETFSVPKRMMPPLNKKVTAPHRQDTQTQSKDNEGFFKPQKQNVSLDPLDGLAKEQNQERKKVYEKQMQYQKGAMEKLLQEERDSRSKQIERLNNLHKEQLIKKLELKDYEIEKLKEFYEMQLKIKSSQEKQNHDLSHLTSKIEQNLGELHKIEGRISQQYTTFQDKRREQENWELKRKELSISKREEELKQLKNKLEQMQNDLKNDKVRFYSEKDRERNQLDEMLMKVSQRQSELEGRFRRKEKDLAQQYDRKRIELDREKQKIRMDNLESQQRKNALINQERQLKNNIHSFEEKRKTLMEQFHQNKAQVMEKQIQLSSKLNDYEMKESQLDMERQQLVNKMKILQLEKKKLQVEARGRHDKNSLSGILNTTMKSQAHRDSSYKIGKIGVGSSFDQYHRTISEMRDEMMRSMPKF